MTRFRYLDAVGGDDSELVLGGEFKVKSLLIEQTTNLIKTPRISVVEYLHARFHDPDSLFLGQLGFSPFDLFTEDWLSQVGTKAGGKGGGGVGGAKQIHIREETINSADQNRGGGFE
jgi:hypothetical protein